MCDKNKEEQSTTEEGSHKGWSHISSAWQKQLPPHHTMRPLHAEDYDRGNTPQSIFNAY